MAPSPEAGATGLDERQRVLIHACSLNRSDIIKKVVSTAPRSSSSSGNGGDGDVDREVLDHVDDEGLTALHYAVKKSSLDVSSCRFGFVDLFHLVPPAAELHVCTAHRSIALCRGGGGILRRFVILPKACDTLFRSSLTVGHPAHTYFVSVFVQYTPMYMRHSLYRLICSGHSSRTWSTRGLLPSCSWGRAPHASRQQSTKCRTAECVSTSCWENVHRHRTHAYGKSQRPHLSFSASGEGACDCGSIVLHTVAL